MTHLSLKLFGSFEATLNGKPIKQFYSDKVRALLAYLITETDQSHHRAVLADLLWPEQPEQQARKNLRLALFHLRKTLNDMEADPPFLRVDRHTVQFNTDSNYKLDLDRFRHFVQEASGLQSNSTDLEKVSFQKLESGATCYRGQFLSQLFLTDSQPFEEWAVLQREAFHQQALITYQALARWTQQIGQFEQARVFVQQWLMHEPSDEAGHRLMMHLYLAEGQLEAALAQYEICHRILATDLGVEPTSETTTLYQEIRLAGTNPNRITLPAQYASFVGRKKELAAVKQQLANPQCRLLTLFGPGGIGKTRLAVEVASQSRRYLQGVYFINLAAVTAVEYIVVAMADAIGFTFSGNSQPQVELIDYLHEKQMLLLLDNFEHLLAGRDLLSAILAEAPNVTMLVTSRRQLQLRAEWVYQLEGLHYPDNVNETGFDDNDAVQLFVENARRIQYEFVLTSENRSAIYRICQLVAGMPLAIELAAAWLPSLTCTEIAAEIECGLDILITTHPDIPSRHRSLQAVFDQTGQMLTENERNVFYKLAVFGGRFEREAALAIANTTQSVLTKLMEYSLLKRDARGYYEIHQLLRQYAATYLAQNSLVEQATYTAHCHYFAQYLAESLTDLRGKNQMKAMQNINWVIADVRLSWRWAGEQGLLETLQQMYLPLYSFFYARSGYQEGSQLFSAAIHNVKVLPQQEEDVVCLLAHLHCRQAAFLQVLGQPDSAQTALERSLAVFQNQHDIAGEAFAYYTLGQVHYHTGRYSEAEISLQQSLALYRQINDKRGVANNLSRLADILSAVLGQYNQALLLADEGLTIYEALGEQHRAAYARVNMAVTLYVIGQYPKAKQLFEQSLIAFRELKDRRGIGLALVNLGAIAELSGAYEAAQAFYWESYELRREVGYKEGMAASLRNLTLVLMHLKDYAQAKRLAQQAFDLYQLVDNRRGMAVIYSALAEISINEADFRRAQKRLVLGLDMAIDIEALPVVVGIVTSAIELAIALDNPSLAVQLAGFVQNHPATYDYYQDTVTVLLDKLILPENQAQIDAWLLAGAELDLATIKQKLATITTIPSKVGLSWAGIYS